MTINKLASNKSIIHGKYNSNVVFYSKTFNTQGFKIRYYPLVDFEWKKYKFGEEPLVFKKGDTLMVCENSVFSALDSVYQYRVLKTWDSCKMLMVENPKMH